jgi:hypothetical protein
MYDGLHYVIMNEMAHTLTISGIVKDKLAFIYLVLSG